MTETIFNNSVVLECAIETGTSVNPHGETAAYVMLAHPELIMSLTTILSIEMLDQLVLGLQQIRDEVTFTSAVVLVKEEDRKSVN